MLLSITTLLLWTSFAFFSKVATTGIRWQSAVLISYVVMPVGVIVYLLMAEPRMSIPFNKFLVFAVIAGITGGLGGVTYYKALKSGPVSIVLPIAGTYTVTTAILGFVLLREPLTLSKVGALGLIIIAIILLSS